LIVKGGISNIYQVKEIIGEEKRSVLLKEFSTRDQTNSLLEEHALTETCFEELRLAVVDS